MMKDAFHVSKSVPLQTASNLTLDPVGNNTQIPAKDRSDLRITFEHAVHSAMPPDTSIL